jgi:N6-adenosine-specific RNA methylase IME4
MIPFPNNKYQVIYADPPWEYRESGGKTNARGLAKQQYPTMPTDDICNLPVREIATDNTICFMWATFPKIDQAIKVMNAWGFEYKTAAFVWVKKNKKSGTNFWGMGAYTRANAEVCLLGISKNTKAKQQVVNNGVHQIIESPIEKHSKKPAETRERIEQLLGDVPKIELFARQKVDGWDVWGNEVIDTEPEQTNKPKGVTYKCSSCGRNAPSTLGGICSDCW